MLFDTKIPILTSANKYALRVLCFAAAILGKNINTIAQQCLSKDYLNKGMQIIGLFKMATAMFVQVNADKIWDFIQIPLV